MRRVHDRYTGLAHIGSRRTPRSGRVLVNPSRNRYRSTSTYRSFQRWRFIYHNRRTLAFQSRVPVVFNSVVGSTRQKTGYGSPFVSESGMCSDYSIILFRRESPMLHLRRKLITPTQPAGFPGPSRNRFADYRPVSRPVLLNKLLKSFVFFRTPWTFDPIHFFSGYCRVHLSFGIKVFTGS
ncbi:hypothetical protein KIW84_024944 [Lathyrus oleraceus]|uniref:Uncharacterized protein n=1 Tax=Pisum sativum TaxID=3888 RepID=A0A9D5B8C3_PEA|nr:hypothetical protein KIW84_024944 [Pisum sativum]